MGQTHLTLYQNQFGLVVEPISKSLHQGSNILTLHNIPEGVIPASIVFDFGETIQVRRQSFQHGWTGIQDASSKLLGQTVIIVMHDGSNFTGTIQKMDGNAFLLSSNSGTEWVTKNDISRIKFNKQTNLDILPTLSAEIVANEALEADGELSYLSRGLDWNADYTVLINKDETKITFTSRVTLSNNTEISFQNASLKLFAGQIHTLNVQRPQKAYRVSAMSRESSMEAVSSSPVMDFHEYQFPTDVNLPAYSENSLFFLEPFTVDMKKKYVFEGGRTEGKGCDISVVFQAVKEGPALPQGVIKSYILNDKGEKSFIGESSLNHTSSGNPIHLKIGNAFDVIGSREITNRAGKTQKYREEEVEVTIRNEKETDVEVDVIENLGYGLWKVYDANLDWTQISAEKILFTVDVASKASQTITYTRRFTY